MNSLLQNPLNSNPSGFGGKLLVRICRIVGVTLPARERLPVRQALQRLLARLPADALAARCVRPVQRHLDACVAQGLGATRVQVRGNALGLFGEACNRPGWQANVYMLWSTLLAPAPLSPPGHPPLPAISHSFALLRRC